MKPLPLTVMNKSADDSSSEWKVLSYCALAALLIEMVALILAGTTEHWMVHPSNNTGIDESHFVEAQVVTMPTQTHLVSQTPSPIRAAKEATISKEVGKGRKAKAGETPLEETNQTRSQNDQTLPATHGPVAFYTPAPVIPSYLQNEELNASVVIEFLVNSRGVATTRLLASSGNEELDAIALNTAKLWQFRPAEDNHNPIDAKIRLRIVFEVK